jgi:ketosteroid isomerase-like protein
MKNALFASGMLLALLAMASAQNPTVAISEDQSQKNELVQLTHEWIDAINAKDRPELDRLMAPDFLLRAWDGTWQVERARWLDNLFHVIDIRAYSHSAISAQVFGDVGAVTSNWYWRGERGTDAKKPFEEHGYVVDMWRRDAGHWRVVSRTSVVLPGKEEPPRH